MCSMSAPSASDSGRGLTGGTVKISEIGTTKTLPYLSKNFQCSDAAKSCRWNRNSVDPDQTAPFGAG